MGQACCANEEPSVSANVEVEAASKVSEIAQQPILEARTPVLADFPAKAAVEAAAAIESSSPPAGVEATPADRPSVTLEFSVGGSEIKTLTFYSKPLGITFEDVAPFVVKKLVPGSEGEKLGVQIGWLFTKVDGQPVDGLLFYDLVNLIRRKSVPLEEGAASGSNPPPVATPPPVQAPPQPEAVPVAAAPAPLPAIVNGCGCQFDLKEAEKSGELTKTDPIQEHYKKGGFMGSVTGAFGDKKTMYCHHTTANGQIGTRAAAKAGITCKTVEDVWKVLGKDPCHGRFAYDRASGKLICGNCIEKDHDATCNKDTCLFKASGLECPTPSWALK